jgi:hypothetical protein
MTSAASFFDSIDLKEKAERLGFILKKDDGILLLIDPEMFGDLKVATETDGENAVEEMRAFLQGYEACSKHLEAKRAGAR